MGVIFPLSWPGKIALILIAITLGLTWWAMKNPVRFAKVMAWFKGNKDGEKKG